MRLNLSGFNTGPDQVEEIHIKRFSRAENARR